MRKSLDHLIEGRTQFVADFSSAIAAGVTIDHGEWKLDREQDLMVGQTFSGAKAGVEIKGGPPGCQYVLTFDGAATDGTPLHAEYWLNTRREPVVLVPQMEPEITGGPVGD